MKNLTIRNKIIKVGRNSWLIEGATDEQIAKEAINVARAMSATKSVQVHRNAPLPFSDGKMTKYARVSMIEK